MGKVGRGIYCTLVGYKREVKWISRPQNKKANRQTKSPRENHLLIRDRLIGIRLVAGSTAASVNLFNDLLAVEQSSSLFQTKTFGFDDKEITEESLKGEPAAVDDL